MEPAVLAFHCTGISCRLKASELNTAWGTQYSSCNTPSFQLEYQTLKEREPLLLGIGYNIFLDLVLLWGYGKYAPTYTFTCTKATENGKCVLNHYQGSNKELKLTANCILHVIRPYWYNQAGFFPWMTALACNRMNRSPVNEVHTRYCCGKRALLARAQGNKCRLVIIALGEVKIWRICSMQATVK